MKRSSADDTATHCPYCALQCGMRLRDSGVVADPSFPVNRGQLCVKGFTAASVLTAPDRLTAPLVRGREGDLQPTSWDEAIERIASAIQETRARFGLDAVGVYGSGALTNEKAYLLGKFARVALGTSNIDYNGRFCMSSAAAASMRAFGLDRGLPFPLEEIARTEAVLLVGSNPAETMPPLMQYFDEQRANGGQLIVADPIRSASAHRALHLQLAPGTDAALANGLLHVLLREGLFDQAFIDERTEGFEKVKATVLGYWSERVERITGVPEAQLLAAARILGSAKSAMVLTGRGPEQQATGVANTLAFINLALAFGKAGTPFTSYGCVTGQGNGQGGREHGQKADQLPGYRRIDDPRARRHLARIWEVPEPSIPGPGKSAFELLATVGTPGGVRALMVFGSNPIVSAPDASAIEERLRSLDFLAVADFFLSETAALADVVLPSAQWAEEEGTMTNLEGRVVHRRRARPPPPGVRTDLEILGELGSRLGGAERFGHRTARDVFDELRRATQGGLADYSGITYEKIDAEGGVFWPCPAEGHPGTPRPFAQRFATPNGRARFHPIPHRPAAEEPGGEYPLVLTTGRLLAHYQSGTQTRRVPELIRAAPAPVARMHPSTARRHGLADRDPVMLVTRRGSARFLVECTPALREDVVFVAFHWPGANRLTNPALDPVSRMPEFKVCAVRIEGGMG
ncbi:MAG TPA: molybdopterin oxidoreductase family protein [Myxococcaceae bacterium]|nr:molybdopterin oxidoreductase family protein [Myxococcaceae bacterium]